MCVCCVLCVCVLCVCVRACVRVCVRVPVCVCPCTYIYSTTVNVILFTQDYFDAALSDADSVKQQTNITITCNTVDILLK